MSTTEKRGIFLTFEGGEGAGKSTQIKLLAARLRLEGRAVEETFEPGGTSAGVEIRRILLDATTRDLRPMAELLLMFAARAQHIEEKILPALALGKIVVSDRFTDSSWVYQGVARGLGSGAVRDLERIACRGLTPNLTILIDLEPETGVARAHARNRERGAASETRLDDQPMEFHRRVREGYLELARREPGRIRVIDGSKSWDEIAERIWDCVTASLPRT